jgi:hypothetical protein
VKELVVNALKSKLIGQMNGHAANIEVMLNNPVGLGDHANLVDTVAKELQAMSDINGQLNTLVRYFEPAKEQQLQETKKDK